MGCHTWIYHNRKPLPGNIEEVAKEFYNEYNYKLEKLLEYSNKLDDELVKTNLLVLYNLVLEERIDEYYEVINKLNEGSDHLGDYLDFLNELLNDQILQIDSSFGDIYQNYMKDLDKYCKKNSVVVSIENFYDNALCEILGISLDQLEDEYEIFEEVNCYAEVSKNGYTFRVYDYPEEIFYTKERLLEFLLDKTLDTTMESVAIDKSKKFIKSEDYDNYSLSVIHNINELYKEYPDAIVEFG